MLVTKYRRCPWIRCGSSQELLVAATWLVSPAGVQLMLEFSLVARPALVLLQVLHPCSSRHRCRIHDIQGGPERPEGDCSEKVPRQHGCTPRRVKSGRKEGQRSYVPYKERRVRYVHFPLKWSIRWPSKHRFLWWWGCCGACQGKARPPGPCCLPQHPAGSLEVEREWELQPLPWSRPAFQLQGHRRPSEGCQELMGAAELGQGFPCLLACICHEPGGSGGPATPVGEDLVVGLHPTQIHLSWVWHHGKYPSGRFAPRKKRGPPWGERGSAGPIPEEEAKPRVEEGSLILRAHG